MKKEIILESRFTTHQKIHMTLYIGGPLIFIIFSMMRTYLNNMGLFILLMFILIYLSLMCLAFTKRGLLKKEDKLYRGLYFFRKLILKKKIDLTDKPKVSILKFNRRQKMGWFSAARPDLSLAFNALDINLLNEKHTRRETLISLTNDEKATEAINFLENEFNLIHERYSPDFS